MTTEVFKIRRKTDGLFSTGGSRPTFNAKGKIWQARGHITSHIRILGNRLSQSYKNCEVVRIEILETELETTDVLDWKPTDSTLRAKELADQRRLEWELARRQTEISQLEKKLATLRNQG